MRVQHQLAHTESASTRRARCQAPSPFALLRHFLLHCSPSAHVLCRRRRSNCFRMPPRAVHSFIRKRRDALEHLGGAADNAFYTRPSCTLCIWWVVNVSYASRFGRSPLNAQERGRLPIGSSASDAVSCDVKSAAVGSDAKLQLMDAH